VSEIYPLQFFSNLQLKVEKNFFRIVNKIKSPDPTQLMNLVRSTKINTPDPTQLLISIHFALVRRIRITIRPDRLYWFSPLVYSPSEAFNRWYGPAIISIFSWLCNYWYLYSLAMEFIVWSGSSVNYRRDGQLGEYLYRMSVRILICILCPLQSGFFFREF